MCSAHHAARDTMGAAIDVCSSCYCDAAVIIAKAGGDPRTKRMTRDALAELARSPQYMAPRNLTLEQAERFERDLFNDPSVLGKWSPRCRGLWVVPDTMGKQALSCCLEDKHTGPHRSEGGRTWRDEIVPAEA